MFYLCSENKGADQLRGYREADLRLCFRICKKPFSHDEAHFSQSHGLELSFGHNVPPFKIGGARLLMTDVLWETNHVLFAGSRVVIFVRVL